VKKVKQTFGGGWTTEKLKRLRKYLVAYTTAMKNQRYQIVYLDAFAGTGYRASPREKDSDDFLFPEIDQFMDGSARIALQVTPGFDKYIFIERDSKRFANCKSSKLTSLILQIKSSRRMKMRTLTSKAYVRGRLGVNTGLCSF
jgi:three-Cys-motif partner protein